MLRPKNLRSKKVWSKTIVGSKKNIVSKQLLGPKKILVQKKIWSIISVEKSMSTFFGPNKYWAQENLR